MFCESVPPNSRDAPPVYKIAVPLEGTEVILVSHQQLDALDGPALLVELFIHPALVLSKRLLEVLRVCWNCQQTFALRYEVNPQLPRLAKEYDCPYCSARQEEWATFADGVDIRPATFPRGRPKRA